MPRLLAKEYVYSATSTDERYNEYLAPATPPLQQYTNSQRHLARTQPTASSISITSKSLSQSPSGRPIKMAQSNEEGDNMGPDSMPHHHHHNVHTISSSDYGDEQQNEFRLSLVPDNISYTRSDYDDEDFEGFEDNCSSVGSDLKQQRTNLKRQSQTDYQDYREDSEGVVEAIEVDDDAVIEEVDGQIMVRSKKGVTLDQFEYQLAECSSHTKNKRQKCQSDEMLEAVSPPPLKTPPDQIVEINSDSTTKSQKRKRQQINTKFQFNLNQRQNHRSTNNAAANKCSTESTSEFPVSSPSNPQQPRGSGKYPPRPPLLKNTLPADSFERQLAMITACNPQMTLTEKIQSWRCEDDQSDVEDVNLFDREFKRFEEQRKKEQQKLKNRKGSSKIGGGGPVKEYDFSIFRQMIIHNMNNQQNQRFSAGGTGGGTCSGGGGLKDIDSSGSDSSKSAKHNDERPSTSAVAQQQLQQRRSKFPNINLEMGDVKKRFTKDVSKRNQNSTTPPATSSSENDRDCFQNPKLSGANKRFHSVGPQIHFHDKLLCPSSSEEANSQDVPTHMQLKTNQKLAESSAVNNVRQKMPLKPPQDKTKSKNSRRLASEQIDSVFRVHQLNPEIDKSTGDQADIKPLQKEEVESSSCIYHESQEQLKQIQFNSIEDDKNKPTPALKPNLFKTPTVPPKYLASHSVPAELPIQTCSSPTQPLDAAMEQISSEMSTSKMEIPQVMNRPITPNTAVLKTEFKLENGETDADFDGVYHQQHEFCSYLGLTGMSTATAMANAVAELAQCNLTRRSMRVLRQQQQERKEKSAKEERELKALKNKQVRKRERGGHEIQVETEETIQMLDEGTNSQTSEHTRSTPSLKKKIINSPMTPKSSNKSQCADKAEPQIKILCHIATKDEIETHKKCVEETVLPLREKLMRQAKKRNNMDDSSRNDICEIKEENTSETKVEGLHVDDIKLEDLTDANAEGHKRTLRSPRSTAMKEKLMKQPQSSTEILENLEQKHQLTEVIINEWKENALIKEIFPKIDQSVVTDPTADDSQETLLRQPHFLSSPFPSKENITRVHDMVEAKQINCGEENQFSCDRALTPTAALIKEKLQAALEESRKTKPSIFIVQSFECKKEKTIKPVSILQPLQMKNVNASEPTTSFSSSPPKVEVKKQMVNIQADIESEIVKATPNKKISKNLLRNPRKAKKRAILSLKNASKRQLRSRKIIFIKSSKTDMNLKEKRHNEVKEVSSQPKTTTKQKLLQRTHKPKENNTINNIQPVTTQSDCTITNTKSYRNVQTETNDLEMYNNHARTRLMAKAAALLQRSRRISVSRQASAGNSLRSRLSAKHTKTQMLQPKICLVRAKVKEPKKEYKTSSTSTTPPPDVKVDEQNLVSMPLKVETTIEQPCQQPLSSSCLNQENENVVVSSTTNSYDERPHFNPMLIPSPITLRSVHSSTPCVIASTPSETKDSWTQSDQIQGIHFVNSPPRATQIMRNPLKTEHGAVLYIYYEVDILIVIQERSVSFWKCSRLLNALSAVPSMQPQQKLLTPHSNVISSHASSTQSQPDLLAGNLLYTFQESALQSSLLEMNHINGEWIMLGELKRLTYDVEVYAPYGNRICLHNSTPIYVEMRARQLPKNHRDCNLLSMYINIYYYHDEDMIAKNNSIQLDTIQSDVKSVNYTTLMDSRYFIMTWPQENLLGKTRSGLCKYSLTPQLDTLASIREFKSMRHTIKYLECMSDDKLIGFGDSQITVWDHRSGDILMNYDLDMPLGKNLGSVYYPSQEIEQNNMIILFQWREKIANEPPELLTIACTITHAQPTYRILQHLPLPPAFKQIKRAINTGEHLIITGESNEEELWICCSNPALVALVPPLHSHRERKRFYNRERPQMIELTEKTLNLDTLANHNLKLAAVATGLALKTV